MKYLSSFCLLILAGFVQAQTPSPVDDGYYSISEITKEKDGYLYTYDTDALRNIYGNAADYDNPYGKNGEHAYFYCTLYTSANLANRTYYISRTDDGRYVIQSCSGEPYSFLDVARYDRHLVIHSPRARQRFSLRDSESTDPWPEDEYLMQEEQGAALFNSLATLSPTVDDLKVLTPLDSSQITPDLIIRRALGNARGALALYPSGDDPGEVSPLLSSTLRDCIEEAQTLADNKGTTLDQAEDISQRLQQATQTYEETAPTALNPMTAGYYWLRSAYRAFMLRQGTEKVMRVEEIDGQQVLRWNDANINNGSTAFLITPSGENMAMQDYMGRWVGHPSQENGTLAIGSDYEGAMQIFRYDTEGMFTIADANAPLDFFSAANSSIGEKGLYGKATDGDIMAQADNYLYPGYCSSWFLEHAYHQVTTSTSGWAVLSVSFPAEVPEGVEVFSVAEKEGALYLVPYTQSVIPARTAVLLRASKGTYTFWSTTQEVPPIADNALVAICEDRKDITEGSMALLRVKNGQVGFQKSSSKKIAAGSAYIPYVEGQENFRALQNVETGIKPIITDREGPAYDLSGRRVYNANANTVIIVNNKKILKR